MFSLSLKTRTNLIENWIQNCMVEFNSISKSRIWTWQLWLPTMSFWMMSNAVAECSLLKLIKIINYFLLQASPLCAHTKYVKWRQSSCTVTWILCKTCILLLFELHTSLKIKATTLIKRAFYTIKKKANGMLRQSAALNKYHICRCICIETTCLKQF